MAARYKTFRFEFRKNGGRASILHGIIIFCRGVWDLFGLFGPMRNERRDLANDWRRGGVFVKHSVTPLCEEYSWLNRTRLQSTTLLQNSCFVTKFMEQNPWDANTSSASQEIPCILLNLNVHCRVHKRPLAILDTYELNLYQHIL